MPHLLGRYYLGRVLKLGNLDQAKLMSAILDSVTLPIGKFTWTFIDIEDARKKRAPYIFGRLAKYAVDGHVPIVDTKQRKKREALAPNLLQASSPFVYLPDYSGIAYLHVWNQIQDDLFPRRFKQLIEATHDNFFVDCTIEPVADYGTFAKRLEKLGTVKHISAKVHPPNPLFGRLWAPLKAYLAERNAQELELRETREGGRGLSTDIVNLVRDAAAGSAELFEKTPAITDAAILMAADGYGHAKLIGEKNGAEIIVRTSDAQESFAFTKEPDPAALAKLATAAFRRVNKQRQMKH